MLGTAAGLAKPIGKFLMKKSLGIGAESLLRKIIRRKIMKKKSQRGGAFPALAALALPAAKALGLGAVSGGGAFGINKLLGKIF